MGFFEHFPYTNFHNLNIQWVLDEFLKLQAFVNKSINDEETQLNNFEKALNNEISNRKIADELLQTQINGNHISIINLRNKHDEDIVKINYEIRKAFQTSKEYTDTEIEKVKELIKQPVISPVFNYFRQKICTLQHTLQDYYLWLRDHAFTAGLFDSAGLSCADLDGIGLTALQYDLEGLVKINDFAGNWPWLAFNPATGLLENVKYLVYNLYQYHLGGLSCGEWDAMTYTTQSFDRAEYTAYQLDWTRDPLALNNA